MELRQRSDRWRRLRLGAVTASRFGDVRTQPRTKAAREAGEWSATAEAYLNELLAEIVLCQPLDTWRSDATDWGTAQEPHAFEAAQEAVRERFGEELQLPEGDCAYLEHANEPHIGCSPDGIIGDSGLLEIKCPYNPAKWIRAKRRGLVLPKEHRPQVQGSLWVTGRAWYAYCWFDPRVTASGIDPLLMIRVERDNDYIAEIAPRILAFRDYVYAERDKLVDKGPF